MMKTLLINAYSNEGIHLLHELIRQGYNDIDLLVNPDSYTKLLHYIEGYNGIKKNVSVINLGSKEEVELLLSTIPDYGYIILNQIIDPNCKSVYSMIEYNLFKEMVNNFLGHTIILISSYDVYKKGLYKKIDESTILSYNNMNTFRFLLYEELLRNYARTHNNIKVIIFRTPMIFGPSNIELEDVIIPNIITSIIKNKTFLFSSEKAKEIVGSSWIDSRDLATFLCYFLTRIDYSGVLNIAAGFVLYSDLLIELGSQMKKGIYIDTDTTLKGAENNYHKINDERLLLDISRFKKLNYFTTQYTVQESIQDTLESLKI